MFPKGIRNIDLLNPVSADIAPLSKPSQPLAGQKFIEIGQSGETGFKPFATAEEAGKVAASIGFGARAIPLEKGFIVRIRVPLDRNNLAVRLSQEN